MHDTFLTNAKVKISTLQSKYQESTDIKLVSNSTHRAYYEGNLPESEAGEM